MNSGTVIPAGGARWCSCGQLNGTGDVSPSLYLPLSLLPLPLPLSLPLSPPLPTPPPKCPPCTLSESAVESKPAVSVWAGPAWAPATVRLLPVTVSSADQFECLEKNTESHCVGQGDRAHRQLRTGIVVKKDSSVLSTHGSVTLSVSVLTELAGDRAEAQFRVCESDRICTVAEILPIIGGLSRI